MKQVLIRKNVNKNRLNINGCEIKCQANAFYKMLCLLPKTDLKSNGTVCTFGNSV